MAKKKLYGAAAAAHAKKMGRGGGGKRRKSVAMTHTSRTVHVHHKAKRKSGGKRGASGPMKLTHLALATAGLAFVTKTGATEGFQKSINEAMDKVPGTKTFGATAMLGIGMLAVDRFIKPNKWLKLLGTAGIVLAAAQIGSKGTDFKFLGDDSEETGDYDLEGDDDIEDIGDDDDDIGDDED
jgi:hypothetical protein